MESNRPRGREKHVTGAGKTVQKRGEGLGTGPVGSPSGHSGRGQPSGGGTRSSGGRGGGMKLIVLLLALLLGGGGGLTAFLGNQSGVPQPPSTGQQQQQPQGNGSTDWAQLLSGLGGGSVSAGWQGEANTGRLDDSVAPGAREKYTKLLGDGRDTATIMVYMCGTDLESRSGMGTSDLQEMLNAKFGRAVNLLVYTGGCKAWNTFCRARKRFFASVCVSARPLPHFSRPGDQLRISYFGSAPFHDTRLISLVYPLPLTDKMAISSVIFISMLFIIRPSFLITDCPGSACAAILVPKAG